MSRPMELPTQQYVLKLDSVCEIPVCIMPFQPQCFPEGMEPTGDREIRCFHIVREDGDLFTTQELERMCYDTHSVDKLLDLCRRRMEAISATYFPGTTNPTFLRKNECEVDSDGYVRVSFFFSRSART